MNIKFNGDLEINIHSPKQKGHASEAAKQAFYDILRDKDMQVLMEGNCKINLILDESILNND